MQPTDARRQCGTPCGCTFVVTGTGGRSCGHGRFSVGWFASAGAGLAASAAATVAAATAACLRQPTEDRKSTRLNSSHTVISYAVFCLKKKKNSKDRTMQV